MATKIDQAALAEVMARPREKMPLVRFGRVAREGFDFNTTGDRRDFDSSKPLGEWVEGKCVGSELQVFRRVIGTGVNAEAEAIRCDHRGRIGERIDFTLFNSIAPLLHQKHCFTKLVTKHAKTRAFRDIIKQYVNTEFPKDLANVPTPLREHVEVLFMQSVIKSCHSTLYAPKDGEHLDLVDDHGLASSHSPSVDDVPRDGIAHEEELELENRGDDLRAGMKRPRASSGNESNIAQRLRAIPPAKSSRKLMKVNDIHDYYNQEENPESPTTLVASINELEFGNVVFKRDRDQPFSIQSARFEDPDTLIIGGDTYKRGAPGTAFQSGWLKVISLLEHQHGKPYYRVRFAFHVGPVAFESFEMDGVDTERIRYLNLRDAEDVIIGEKRPFKVDGQNYMEYAMLVPIVLTVA